MEDELKLTAALAEFQAVRSEQVARLSAQTNLVAPAIAILALVGAVEPAFRIYMPFALFGVGAVYYSQRLWINQLGQYTREILWPAVSRISGYSESFEAFLEDLMWVGSRRAVMVVLEAGIPVLLGSVSVVMILTAGGQHIVIAVVAWAFTILNFSLLPVAVYAIRPRLTPDEIARYRKKVIQWAPASQTEGEDPDALD